MTPEPLRYSVLGTCVTRDAGDVGRAPLGRPVKYYSRTRIQSVVSTPTPIDPAEITTDNIFNRQVILNDHRKTAATTLPRLDHPIVVDLGDERLPLTNTGHGLVTATRSFKQDFLGREGYTRVPEDTELREDGPFAEACRRFAALLRPDQRIIVHRTFWATREADGKPVGRIEESERHNAWLEPAYELFIRALGPRATVIDMPEELRVPDPNSRWGHAPVHFIAEYHEFFAAKVRALLSAPVPAQRAATSTLYRSAAAG
ncbi:DUF6270 domain-containing protein [Glycomyces tenuis]|uniref:DUF6270 domain-containing protein n=1 Tax=Glycomyces tenuis TaxID=58116 RepID=UPI000422CBD1|nr:DUF6270 domain-containing protein [Glycomyces tenuis]